MIIDVFVPLFVVLMMLVVGTELSPDQLRQILRAPLPLVGGTMLQTLLLPPAALVIILWLEPSPVLAAGLLLVAACPGGGLSNFYCYLGRLNLALSVLLTALSSMLAFVLLPLVLAVAFPVLSGSFDVEIPAGRMSLQLSLFLLLPIGVGMAVRRRFPGWLGRNAARLRRGSLYLLAALLLLVVVDQWETVRGMYLQAAVLALLFTGAAVVLGWGAGAALRLDRGDRFVFAIEFAIRNLGAAALVAATSLGRPELLAFGALFLVYQFPLILLLLSFAQRNRVAEEIS